MTGNSDNAVFGVDGGGTACRIALVHDGRRFESRLGPANVTTDLAGAIATVRQGIARVADQAGLAPEAVSRIPAHVALAGLLNTAQAQEVRHALGLNDAIVADDRLAAVVGALGGDDGAVAGVGTGSFLGRCSGGTVRFAGGWGLILGDEASGAWLGREALAAALRAADGLAAQTGLGRALIDRFNGPEGIVVFAASASPAEFGEIAREVVRAAGSGDSSALSLMRRGADYLGAGLRALGWQGGEPLCLVGGVSSAYADWLDPELARALRPAAGSALDGALRLAADQKGSSV